jgi:hypothetical protein
MDSDPALPHYRDQPRRESERMRLELPQAIEGAGARCGLAKPVRAIAGRVALISILGLFATGLGLFAVGCSESFGDQVRRNRPCIGQAQIEPPKVDTCLRNTNGRRKQIDLCLVGAMVSDEKIQRLNDCVDTREYYGSY